VLTFFFVLVIHADSPGRNPSHHPPPTACLKNGSHDFDKARTWER
jgi:hypothetical protein